MACAFTQRWLHSHVQPTPFQLAKRRHNRRQPTASLTEPRRSADLRQASGPQKIRFFISGKKICIFSRYWSVSGFHSTDPRSRQPNDPLKTDYDSPDMPTMHRRAAKPHALMSGRKNNRDTCTARGDRESRAQREGPVVRENDVAQRQRSWYVLQPRYRHVPGAVNTNRSDGKS